MTTTRPQWGLAPSSQWETPPPLPSGVPIAARLVHGAYYVMNAEIRRDIRDGHNSRRVSFAFDQLDARAPFPLRLSRRERGRGIEYLVKLEATAGGVLL